MTEHPLLDTRGEVREGRQPPAGRRREGTFRPSLEAQVGLEPWGGGGKAACSARSDSIGRKGAEERAWGAARPGNEQEAEVSGTGEAQSGCALEVTPEPAEAAVVAAGALRALAGESLTRGSTNR